MSDMKRCEFITLLGGAAAAWPLAARAQQPGKLPIIGFLGAATPSATSPWTAAFVQRLREFGWIEGRTIAIEYRWAEGRAERFAEIAAEFVGLRVDLIVTHSTAPVVAAKEASGFVESLSRPGGNATGFMQFEYSLSGKWLELLKQIAPAVTRAAVLRDSALISGIGQFAVIQSVASSEVSPVNVREAGEIERAIAAFARSPNGGLVVTSSALAVRHRELIIALAARHKLPAIYYRRYWIASAINWFWWPRPSK
jgi:ABC-type uncharacterized transport system substrate-binding protein